MVRGFLMNVTYKKCNKCKQDLPLDCFYKKHKNSSKRCSSCKLCDNKRKKVFEQSKRGKILLSERRRRYKKEKVEKKICVKCSNKAIGSLQICENHYFQSKSYSHFNSKKYWRVLREILIKQEYKCVYTKETLSFENMSLDHKISINDNPSLKYCINNVHWVTKKVNRMKHKLSNNDFLNTCKLIVEVYENL